MKSKKILINEDTHIYDMKRYHNENTNINTKQTFRTRYIIKIKKSYIES